MDDDGWPEDSIPIEEVPACWLCDSLVAWQSWTGVWHCLRCDPPTNAVAFWSYQKRQATAAVVDREALRRDRMVRDAAKRVTEFFGEEAV